MLNKNNKGDLIISDLTASVRLCIGSRRGFIRRMKVGNLQTTSDMAATHGLHRMKIFVPFPMAFENVCRVDIKIFKITSIKRENFQLFRNQLYLEIYFKL